MGFKPLDPFPQKKRITQPPPPPPPEPAPPPEPPPPPPPVAQEPEPEPEPPREPRQPVPFKTVMRWVGIAAAGIIVTALAGYLVATFVLFPSPLRTREREVPHVLGLAEAEAGRSITRQGLEADVSTREPHPLLPAGTVVWQDPPPGVAVPRGFRIELTISTGVPRIGVPDVRGFETGFAHRLLTAAGLGVDAVDSVDDVSMQAGLVAGTSPGAGDSVPLGLRLLLHVTR